MNISLLNVVTLIAYAAIASDLIIEISRVWRRRHGDDISAVGTSIRALAAMVILTKLTFVGDPVLIVGQTGIVTLLSIYLILVIHFRKHL